MDETSRLKLEQPGYLSDGALAIAAMNSNMTKLDDLISKYVVYEGDIVTYGGEIVISIL